MSWAAAGRAAAPDDPAAAELMRRLYHVLALCQRWYDHLDAYGRYAFDCTIYAIVTDLRDSGALDRAAPVLLGYRMARDSRRREA